ncbi:unnamed protein product [Phytophthora fragariaefolia]|uniref:Unnamed protein product n=1 Tax=Phytophthora fragariaefolia TaxID=1490495 RepID=A0A9W6TP00_9STRA|nr:unnamed protein product [Phytophthora fragariaefolia]
MGLVYKHDPKSTPVQVYTDADSDNNDEDRKSVSGCLIQVHGCTVSWQTKRQRIVSKLSTIAEYIAADGGVEEVQWTKMHMNKLLKF